MSFIKLQSSDIVVSADSITAPCWSAFAPSLTQFFTGSNAVAKSSAPKFFLDVYQQNSTGSAAEVQFSILYGNLNGSGSENYNDLVPYATPTRTIYGQYRTLVFGDENTNFTFGSGATVEDIFILNINRNRYKEHLLPGSFNLKLADASNNPITLTDNSKVLTINTYGDAGRVFDIVSGSFGTPTTAVIESGVTAGYTKSGSYGMFLPDVGLIIFNARALSLPFAKGGVQTNINPSRTYDTDDQTYNQFYNALINPNASAFQLNSEETISANYVFIRVPNAELNYTTNPSMISGSGDFVYTNFVNSPQTFPTTVGLYNDNNELLAVAKLSKPFVKDFTKEALFRLKLDW